MTTPSENGAIILLGGNKSSTRILYHALKKDFPITKVILEERVGKVSLLKRRIKKLGLARVSGQIGFSLLVVPWLRRAARRRRAQIMETNGLQDCDIPSTLAIRVPSVNSAETIAALQSLNPSIVIVNGTRIISSEVLGCISAVFVNTHAGVTPLYRGVHGAYWALVKDDRERCGVTVHLVDAGIDTGSILRQQMIQPQADDSFVTYPLLQQALGIQLLREVIRDGLMGLWPTGAAPAGQSKLWSHPTLWQYIWHRLRSGVK